LVVETDGERVVAVLPVRSLPLAALDEADPKVGESMTERFGSFTLTSPAVAHDGLSDGSGRVRRYSEPESLSETTESAAKRRQPGERIERPLRDVFPDKPAWLVAPNQVFELLLGSANTTARSKALERQDAPIEQIPSSHDRVAKVPEAGIEGEDGVSCLGGGAHIF
jgi:hypothetical protein